jgi:hypothetical protein
MFAASGLSARRPSPASSSQRFSNRSRDRAVSLGRVHALGGERAHRGAQRQPPATHAAHEADVDERHQPVDRVAERGLGEVGREVGAEGAQLVQQLLLRGLEQLGRPLEHRAQAALALGQVAAAGAERVDSLLEPPQQAGRVEHAQPRRGQLDGQRHALEPPAQLRDVGGVGGVERELRPGRPRALEQQRDRGH